MLANIALHGLEALVKTTIKGAHLVRFADDFVVFHHDREAIFKAQTLIRQWLSSRGLEIRADKTRIVHTLNGDDEYPTGFDFLGCHVRQYRTRRRSINKSQRPYKTLIKPSKASLKRLVTKLGEIIKRHRGCSQEALITALNPIIVGWANYHRSNVASRVFAYLDEEPLYRAPARSSGSLGKKNGAVYTKNSVNRFGAWRCSGFTIRRSPGLRQQR